MLAVAPDGYHFDGWILDGEEYSTDNPLTVTNVIEDMTLIANFTDGPCTLTYAAGPNGTISGETAQTVDYGSSGSPVEAIPDEDFFFLRWSDMSTDNPRTDADVTADISVTASFGPDRPTSVEEWRPYE
jgi:hypothetical protein